MTNSVLSKCLYSLADAFEGKSEGMSTLIADIGSQYDIGRKRFFYEAILERSPETARLADSETTNPVETIKEFLLSKEFRERHIAVIRDLFPDRNAKILLHVPKTGGNTINTSLVASGAFVSVSMPQFADPEWGIDLLSYYGRVISELRNSSKTLAIHGHPTARYLINNRLTKPGDHVFAFVRSPIDLMISWMNYYLTIVHDEYKRGSDGSIRPDVKYVHTAIGHDWIDDPRNISDELLEVLIGKTIGYNPICSTIGFEPNFTSAVETSIVLGIEVVQLADINSFMTRNALPHVQDQNISKKFVQRDTLSAKILEMVYDRVGEDLKFYDFVSATKSG